MCANYFLSLKSVLHVQMYNVHVCTCTCMCLSFFYFLSLSCAAWCTMQFMYMYIQCTLYMYMQDVQAISGGFLNILTYTTVYTYIVSVNTPKARPSMEIAGLLATEIVDSAHSPIASVVKVTAELAMLTLPPLQ